MARKNNAAANKAKAATAESKSTEPVTDNPAVAKTTEADAGSESGAEAKATHETVADKPEAGAVTKPDTSADEAPEDDTGPEFSEDDAEVMADIMKHVAARIGGTVTVLQSGADGRKTAVERPLEASDILSLRYENGAAVAVTIDGRKVAVAL